MNYTETRIPHRESSRKKRQHQAGIGCFPHMPAIPALGSPGTGCQTSLSYRASPGPCSDFSGYALTVQLSSGFLVESNPRGSQSIRLCLPSPYLFFHLSPSNLLSPLSITPSTSHPLIQGPFLSRAHTSSLILLEVFSYYLGPVTCPPELQTALLG